MKGCKIYECILPGIYSPLFEGSCVFYITDNEVPSAFSYAHINLE